MRPSKKQDKPSVVAQTFNPSTQEEDPGQLGLHSETLPQNKTTTKKSPQLQNKKKELQQTRQNKTPQTDSQEGERKEAVETAYTNSHSPFYRN